MKKIDKMMVKGFIGPFIVTFFIALFVLTMQVLWLWVDDLVGKGVGILVIFELLFYLILSFFQAAFPIAILLSSVMLMGGYAERYELSSMTSAGMPLLRIMRPLIVFAVGVAITSFICSNYLWPVANLQFRSRLLDIRNQKPTLSIRKGVFNHDFTGYVIRVEDKSEDDISVKGIMIYDNQKQLDKINLITAEYGQMYTDNDKNLFIMKLNNGHQYQETDNRGSQGGKYPFVRVNFKEYTKSFDMSQFDFNRSETDLYKSHHTMLNIKQLNSAIDSIDIRLQRASNVMMYNVLETVKPRNLFPPKSNDIKDTTTVAVQNAVKIDSTQPIKITSNQPSNIGKRGIESFRENVERRSIEDAINTTQEKIQAEGNNSNRVKLQDLIDPSITQPSMLDRIRERYKTPSVNYATSLAKSSMNGIVIQEQIYRNEYESRVRHVFEINVKLAISTICIVFLFIGVPMGSIVRKGGFGYPLLIAIIFYMVFQVSFTAMKKSAESHVIAPWIAPWIPVIFMSIIGIYLTRRAMNDSKLNLDGAAKWFISLFNKSSELYYRISNKVLTLGKKK